MNEEDIRTFLNDGLQAPPGKHFNDRVLARVPPLRKPKHFLSFDEPGMLVLFGVICLAVPGIYFLGKIDTTSSLVLVAIISLLVFITAFNMLNRRVFGK